MEVKQHTMIWPPTGPGRGPCGGWTFRWHDSHVPFDTKESTMAQMVIAEQAHMHRHISRRAVTCFDYCSLWQQDCELRRSTRNNAEVYYQCLGFRQ